MNLIEALKQWDKVTCDELIEDNCTNDVFISIDKGYLKDYPCICIHSNVYEKKIHKRYLFSESYREYTSNTEGNTNE